MDPTANCKQNVPFDHSYWVIAAKLLAGSYSGASNKKQTSKNLKSLLGSGIRYVINLMEPHELDGYSRLFVPYEDQIGAIAASMGTQITIERMPVRDMSVPPKAMMCHILDQIDKCIRLNKPVYIHCLGGRGRTGTVAGCFLVRHAFASGKTALERLQKLRKHTTEQSLPSPETSEQRYMVNSWVKGE